MVPLTRAAVSSGFSQPEKIATQVKMRPEKKKTKNESAFGEVKAELPALQGLLAASLSSAGGTRRSVHVGLMPGTMRVGQGKVQRNPLWLLSEKVTVLFH